MTQLPPPTCEVDQWVLTECAKRQRSGETVSAMLAGVGADEEAQRLAASGARVLLLSDHQGVQHENVVQRPASLLADHGATYPLEPFDIVLCQRSLSTCRYVDAVAAVNRLLHRLKIGGKLFISLYGIHSELGEQYADGGKLINHRFAPVSPETASRYHLDGPVCLYSERNLFMLLMEAGGAVLKTSSSALGHVRGVAARV